MLYAFFAGDEKSKASNPLHIDVCLSVNPVIMLLDKSRMQETGQYQNSGQ